MSDLIDRQAAINAVCMEWCGVKHQDCKHPFDVEEGDYYWCDGCETVLRTLPDLSPAQPERLTDDDFEAIRIHLNAHKENLCNQRRWEEAEEYQRIIDRFMAFASAQQDCTECPDYDNETHSCPKYCDVIRKTLEEAKQERTGRWIQHEDSEDMFLAFLTPYHCSECGAVCRDIHDKWCYGCGARMEGEG